MPRTTEPLDSRFWRKVDRSQDVTACWEWNRCRLPSGYGRFSIEGQTYNASRIAFALAYPDEQMEGLEVCHTCDNPPCCNPAHLFLGTHRDNTLDAIAKGRGYRGGRWPMAVYLWHQAIRRKEAPIASATQ